jgi:hypothetical protein
VPDKAQRVRQFHDSTLAALAELLGAAGLSHPNGLRPDHILKRVSQTEVQSFADVYGFLAPGALLDGGGGDRYRRQWATASAASFSAVETAEAAE